MKNQSSHLFSLTSPWVARPFQHRRVCKVHWKVADERFCKHTDVVSVLLQSITRNVCQRVEGRWTAEPFLGRGRAGEVRPRHLLAGHPLGMVIFFSTAAKPHVKSYTHAPHREDVDGPRPCRAGSPGDRAGAGC